MGGVAHDQPPMASAFQEVPCNLCGGEASRVLYHRSYERDSPDSGLFAATTDHFQNYGRIVRCLDCGLVYTNPRPRPDQLLAGYAGCTEPAYLDESSSRSINAHLSLRTIKRAVAGGRLLEVGCSTGHFLSAAKSDFEVFGVDPSRWACEVARSRFGLEVYAEDFGASNRFAPGSFDVVAMIDVLEHLSDPKRCVTRAAELLKDGGILYLVTPDIASLSARILRSYWWGLRPAHIYYFSEASLKRLLSEAGFEVVLAKSFGRIFSYGYWASRLRHYPKWLYGPLRAVIESRDLADKLLYLDTRDSIELCARKSKAPGARAPGQA